MTNDSLPPEEKAEEGTALIDVALEEMMMPRDATVTLSRSTEQNHTCNRETIKTGNVAKSNESPHESPQHKKSNSGGSILLNSSTRALRGSERGQRGRGGRTSMIRSIQFGRLPSNIECRRGDEEEGVTSNDNDNDDKEDNEVATWGDVCHSCCCHSPKEWGTIFFAIVCLLFCLYFFLVGLDLMGTSFQVVGGCTAGSILGEDTNPIASLMIGILATAILQSSSTTTAIIVSLVSGGLDVRQAIYMVMGANIGTSVTSIIVTLGHLGNGDELERAFAGATVNFVFKILTVIILFPIEVATGYLYYLTKAMLPATVDEGEKWEGPIKQIVAPLSKKIIIANKALITNISVSALSSDNSTVATENETIYTCDTNYPVQCSNNTVSYETCIAGLIGCDKSTNQCPAFFREGSSLHDDMVSGGVCLFLSFVILILSLYGLVVLLRRMLLGASTRIIYKATNINPYFALLVGMGVTVLVQSSSITTSTLVPLAGIGVLKLEQMYPLTIGADIGTTFTALMAAMVSSSVEALQVALAHLFFNITGFIIYYPVPFMRRIPIRIARKLGKATRIWRGFPILFIVVMFLLVPLLLFGLSTLFEQDSIGWIVLGAFLVIFLGLGLIYFIIWFNWRGGSRTLAKKMAKRQRKNAAVKDLPDDMDYLKADMEYVKNEIMKLKDFAGVVESSMNRIQQRHDHDVSDERSEATWQTMVTAEDLSLYHTCRDKNWAGVIGMGASQGNRSTLGASLASHINYWGEL